MATTTTNYGLTKPSYGDNADIAVINSNMDKIDAKMKEIEDAGGGGASTWAEVENKPFETVGSGLNVDESGALNVTGGGSGGSSVEWNQIQTSGSKIAEVTIDGTKTDVYAPTGGSGGGGGRTKQTLYTNSTESAQSIVLSDSYKNYDLLMFRIIRIAEGAVFQEEKCFDKDWLEQCQNSSGLFQFFAYTQWNTYQVTDETHFTLTNSANGVCVREVVGVNF